MLYIPKKNKMFYFYMFFVGIIILLALFVLSSFKIVSQTLCQFVFFFESVFYTYILSKFYLPVYIYKLEENRFKIIKEIGNKNITECDIDYFNIVDIISKKEYKKQEHDNIKSLYNYNSNIISRSCYYLIFKYSERYEAVMFEPNEEMVEKIRTIISQN